MEAERFGKIQRECAVCGQTINEFRVLRIRITSSFGGGQLASLGYKVPLCDKHGGARGDKAVRVEVSWDKDLSSDE